MRGGGGGGGKWGASEEGSFQFGQPAGGKEGTRRGNLCLWVPSSTLQQQWGSFGAGGGVESLLLLLLLRGGWGGGTGRQGIGWGKMEWRGRKERKRDRWAVGRGRSCFGAGDLIPELSGGERRSSLLLLRECEVAAAAAGAVFAEVVLVVEEGGEGGEQREGGGGGGGTREKEERLSVRLFPRSPLVDGSSKVHVRVCFVCSRVRMCGDFI